MRQALEKFVVLSLLMVQLALIAAPSGWLCLPLGQHDGHDRHGNEVLAACGHSRPHTCTASDALGSIPESVPSSIVSPPHPTDEHCCHVHLPIPRNELTTLRTRHPASSLVAVAPGWALPMKAEAPATSNAESDPPPFCASAPMLALKATRLLI